MVCSSSLSSTIRSISRKYSSRMQSRLPWGCALGCNQFVDPSREILQDEVLFGRRLPIVDFLGPLLERQLDAEGLVDRECDIEEVEAVDPEVVDRMALRRDLLAVDVAGFGNDIGDGVKSRRHRQASEMLSIFGSGAGSRTSHWAGPRKLPP